MCVQNCTNTFRVATYDTDAPSSAQVQFLGVFLHSAQVFLQPNCPVDRSNMVFLMIQSIIMTSLFSNFYYQSYIKKKEA